MEECCLYILKLLDSGLKLQNPMLEASRQSSNSNLIIIALSNLLLAVNPRSGNFFYFWPRFHILVLGINFFYVTSTFSIFFLDFYSPFLFGLLFPFSISTFFISFPFFLSTRFQFSFNFFFLFFFNSSFIQSRSHFGFLPNF